MWQKGDCCVCLFVCLPVCLFVLIFKIGLEGPRKMTYFVLELLGGFLHGDERGKSHKFRFLTGIRLTPCKWPQMPLNGFSTQFYFLILTCIFLIQTLFFYNCLVLSLIYFFLHFASNCKMNSSLLYLTLYPLSEGNTTHSVAWLHSLYSQSKTAVSFMFFCTPGAVWNLSLGVECRLIKFQSTWGL